MYLPFLSSKKDGRLPNLVIIGAQKCGTTSLHYYLGHHPEIRMTLIKELDFFPDQRNWHKGVDWYKSHFRGDFKVLGESSPNYTYYPKWQNVPERMHSVIPDAKLIYLVRDPIERIISHYIHRCAAGLEHRTIEECLEQIDSNNIYVCRSMYHMQLSRFLSHYDQKQILVLNQQDLLESRLETLTKVFDFLGVDNTVHNDKFMNLRHKSSKKRQKTNFGTYLSQLPIIRSLDLLRPGLKWRIESWLYRPFSEPIRRPQLNEDTVEKLTAYLTDDINQFRALIGTNTKNWSI